MKKLLVLLILFYSPLVLCKTGYYEPLSLSFGMISLAPTENESALTKSTDTTDTTAEVKEAAEPVSAMSVNAHYEFLTSQKRTYFAEATLPVMAAGGTGVFLLGGGVNWYLSDLATKYTYEKNGSSFEIYPQLNYYWGINSGIGYLVYQTDSSKKSDVFFDLGVHAGGGYALSNIRNLKLELGVSRATGVQTTGLKMTVLFGVVQYL